MPVAMQSLPFEESLITFTKQRHNLRRSDLFLKLSGRIVNESLACGELTITIRTPEQAHFSVSYRVYDCHDVPNELHDVRIDKVGTACIKNDPASDGETFNRSFQCSAIEEADLFAEFDANHLACDVSF